MGELKLGLQSLGEPVWMATAEDIQLDWISLKPRVVLQSPKALMSSRSLCGMAREDSSHGVHKFQD